MPRIPAAALSSSPTSSWRSTSPFIYRFASWWFSHGPRGGIFLPNLIGRTLLKNTRMTIPLRSGARLAVDTSHLDIYCRIDLDKGTWEGHVLEACLNMLRAGDVFYDIGANAGVFSIECALKFRDQIKVHAFEPQPTLVERIRNSAELNHISGLSVHEILLSDKAGEGTLFVTRQSVHASLIAREAHAHPVRVRMTPLDDFIEQERLPPPTLIKIDVEGAELQVFRGARKTLAVHKPVIVFEADQNMQRFGYDHATLFSALQEAADYQILRLMSDSTMQPLRESDMLEETNYVALPSDRRELLAQNA